MPVLLMSVWRMSKLTFLVALLVVVCGVVQTRADVEDAWQQYLKEYPLGIKTKAEYGKSKSNFERIHSLIEEHNADPKSTYQMGHNEFSILDVEERKKYLLNNTLAYSTKSLYEELGFETGLTAEEIDDLRNLPSSVDYRNHRCMQPVKNQGACGSCSAFAATAVVEFAQCMKSGTPVNLSEQQIVDCDFADRRCGGGSYHEYWKSLIRAGGQAYSAGYPYVSGATKVRGPTCDKNKSKGAQLAATNPIVALQKGDVNGVMTLLARGKVVAVCVAVTDKFMNYRSGVYTTPCKGREGLHAIAAVGYGTSNGGTKYWIIRNSWGPKFGDTGYILFQRGINLCGVEGDLATVNVA